MLVDEFMPVYDVSDAVATVVEADVATTWAALMDVDLIDVGRKRPLVAVLGALRILPDIVSHLLHGELPPRQPEHFKLRDLATIPLDKGGWVLLGLREQDEIALGLVGKFWRPVIEFASVSSAAEFRDFASRDSPRRSTRSPFGPSIRDARCCQASCGRPRPTNTRGDGSAGIGPSASDRVRTCWSTASSTSRARWPNRKCTSDAS